MNRWLNVAVRYVLLVWLAVCGLVQADAQRASNEIAWALRSEPKTLDPALTNDGASETVRFLTGGVLLRLNRKTLAVEPALAERYEISPDGRNITLRLRPGLKFSDGAPLSSADAAWTLRRVLTPATNAPVAEEFGGADASAVSTPDPLTVRVQLPHRIVAIAQVFDEIPIEPANRPSQSRVTAGPFVVAEYLRGQSLHLRRNPFYWRRDAAGHQLPYLDGVRLDVVTNPETNELRFLRGQYQLLESVPAEQFNVLAARSRGSFRDFGASLNTEQMWFNQSPRAPLPEWERAWFADRSFREAVSQALRRADMVRIAYDGHATPANGFISVANPTWRNAALPPLREDRGAALAALATAGFHQQGGKLLDRAGHPVRFSLLTSAGNRAREKLAVLVQQDLAALGMEVTLTTLDFPAMLERLTHTGEYEAALLGLGNVQPDPSAMDNIWLSSSPAHSWNPSEKQPATPWEAELDRLVQAQSAAGDFTTRKRAVDRMQSIVAQQQPFIYLLYPNLLYAVSPELEGVELTPLQPGVVSRIDSIHWKGR